MKLKKRFFRQPARFRQPVRSRYQPPPFTIWDWAIASLVAGALLSMLVYAYFWLIANHWNF